LSGRNPNVTPPKDIIKFLRHAIDQLQGSEADSSFSGQACPKTNVGKILRREFARLKRRPPPETKMVPRAGLLMS